MVYTRLTFIGLSLIVAGISISGLPLASDDLTVIPEDTTSDNSTNSTAKDLYVIRAIVYEVGILTDASADELGHNETITNEKVDLTFFNAMTNGSIIDLGDIPLPIQTNVSGQIITGIAPVHAGEIHEAIANLTAQLNGITDSDDLSNSLSESDAPTLPLVTVTRNFSISGPPSADLVADLTNIPISFGDQPFADLIAANNATEESSEESE